MHVYKQSNSHTTQRHILHKRAHLCDVASHANNMSSTTNNIYIGVALHKTQYIYFLIGIIKKNANNKYIHNERKNMKMFVLCCDSKIIIYIKSKKVPVLILNIYLRNSMSQQTTHTHTRARSIQSKQSNMCVCVLCSLLYT